MRIFDVHGREDSVRLRDIVRLNGVIMIAVDDFVTMTEGSKGQKNGSRVITRFLGNITFLGIRPDFAHVYVCFDQISPVMIMRTIGRGTVVQVSSLYGELVSGRMVFKTEFETDMQIDGDFKQKFIEIFGRVLSGSTDDFFYPLECGRARGTIPIMEVRYLNRIEIAIRPETPLEIQQTDLSADCQP